MKKVLITIWHKQPLLEKLKVSARGPEFNCNGDTRVITIMIYGQQGYLYFPSTLDVHLTRLQ